ASLKDSAVNPSSVAVPPDAGVGRRSATVAPPSERSRESARWRAKTLVITDRAIGKSGNRDIGSTEYEGRLTKDSKPRSFDSGFPRWRVRAGALPRSG